MQVVTLGETMSLFTPDTTGLMRYAQTYSRKFGGAESNYAIGLTRLGHQTGWISRIGDDELGKGMLSFIKGEGVDVSQVKVDSRAQTGIYFKELRRAGEVCVKYYRSDSAASNMGPEDLNEDYIAQAKYLFLSGITPALSESCYEMVKESIRIAKKFRVKVIFDPNLRKKLWSDDKARKVFLEIASNVDIILPGIDEGIFMFGEKNPEELGKLFLNQGASIVVMKMGANGAYFFTKKESKFVPGFKVEKVVDPVGAGDGFAAGFTSGLIDGLDLTESVRRGNAVGAMVTMVNGDVEGLPERADIENFINPGMESVSR